MKTFEITDNRGNIFERIKANSAREALCIYLMKHEELVYMSLYRCPLDVWKLAENSDNYLLAIEINI